MLGKVFPPPRIHFWSYLVTEWLTEGEGYILVKKLCASGALTGGILRPRKASELPPCSLPLVIKLGNYILIFRRVRKIAKSDCWFCHGRPTVRVEQLGFHWTHFHEIWYLGIFRKSVMTFQFSLISDKNNGYFTWRPLYVCGNISRWILLRKEKRLGICFRENQNTLIWSVTFLFRKSCHVWHNLEKYGRATEATDSIIQRVWIARWINKATDIHSECVILIALSRRQWLIERTSMWRLYVYCLS